tara:strand:- start:233 stop:796 length:564 start_codon:yes stop_codon:yes gene_type:complete
MPKINKFIIASLFVISFFLFSCTKTKSNYIQDLDGKLFMNDLVAIGTKQIYESRSSNEFGVCGGEYGAARKYHLLDINDDGYEDLLVFIVLEGFDCTNAYAHYLFIATAKEPKYDTDGVIYVPQSFSHIGQRGFNINGEYFGKKKNNLIFKALTYNEGDALCCPSKKVKRVVSISSLDSTLMGEEIY